MSQSVRKKLQKTKIKKNVDFEKKLGDKIIVLKDKKIYEFNEEGATIWKYIDKIPLHQICKEIAKIRKQKVEEVQKDVQKFLEELSRLGIITTLNK